MNKKRLAAMLVGIGLVAAACSTGADTASTTTVAPAATPATSPASVAVDDQTSDGTTIVVASVDLPSAGFVAVHADNDGSPGPVIGRSDLLPAGTTDDVTITLDTALEGTSTVFPMVHIDMDGDGEYTFQPPDNVVDVPGMTVDGKVAVASARINL